MSGNGDAMQRQGRVARSRCGLAMVVLLAGTLAACGTTPPDAGRTGDIQRIRLNQLGYLPGAAKLGVVEGGSSGGFQVVSAGDGQVVLSGRLSSAVEWEPAARLASIADLGALHRPGTYRLQVQGLPPSDPFVVSSQAYGPLADAALKAYYYNRAGIGLDATHAGRWARPAGHPDTQVRIHASAASAGRPAGTIVSAPGGWYDAGDYNKYVVNSGISMWSLLSAYEHFPGFFDGRDLGIPESGDAVPDILDEAWWNLRWMLAMQDPGDGGVYHKLSTLAFAGAVMPDRADAPRYMVGKSTAAALDFAAVMAMASRVYASHEADFPGEPARMRAAAQAAWRWALAHPDAVYRQPADVHTGAYGDESLGDEFAWAAAELYLLTGEEQYRQAFGRHAADARVPGWPDVGTLGWISLAQHRQRLPAEDRVEVERQLRTLASALAADWARSPWRVSIQTADFRWGSNSAVLNKAILLVQGYRLSGERTQLDAAQAQLDWVLGRNPLGVSFVTGQGVRSPRHVHHRPSQADGIDDPVPGWLSGGPNPGQQDAGDCGAATYASSLPALSWLDHDCSYASNEVAINWNAPLVYVAAAVQSLTPPVPAGKATAVD